MLEEKVQRQAEWNIPVSLMIINCATASLRNSNSTGPANNPASASGSANQ